MFTIQKIGRTVFVSLYFDKIVYYANAMDGMYVNAHKKWPSHKFLVCTSLLFNKNIPQVAARATRLQWLKIEQKHRMTSSTWFRGCRTKSVIGHRTWSIIGHSTITSSKRVRFELDQLDSGAPGTDEVAQDTLQYSQAMINNVLPLMTGSPAFLTRPPPV